MSEENKRFDDEHLCKTYELLNTPNFRNYVYDFDGKGNYCEYIDEYEVKIDELQNQLQQKENIIKELNDKIEDDKMIIEGNWGCIDNLRKDYNLQKNIIKEVREYIESNKIYTNEKQEAYTLKNTWYGLELLEILDKEVN